MKVIAKRERKAVYIFGIVSGLALVLALPLFFVQGGSMKASAIFLLVIGLVCAGLGSLSLLQPNVLVSLNDKNELVIHLAAGKVINRQQTIKPQGERIILPLAEVKNIECIKGDLPTFFPIGVEYATEAYNKLAFYLSEDCSEDNMIAVHNIEDIDDVFNVLTELRAQFAKDQSRAF